MSTAFNRFASVSKQLYTNQFDYYKALEKPQQAEMLDITEWLHWFIGKLVHWFLS